MEILKDHILPPIEIYSNTTAHDNSNDAVGSKENIEWDNFYSEHLTADVYKPRRYLIPEFYKWLNHINNLNVLDIDIDTSSNNKIHVGGTILEVGCGHGCTVQPLFPVFENIQFKLTDYSIVALKLLSNNIEGVENVPIDIDIEHSTPNEPPIAPVAPAVDPIELDSNSNSTKKLSSRQRRKMNKTLLKTISDTTGNTSNGNGSASIIGKEHAHRILFQQWDITQPYVENTKNITNSTDYNTNTSTSSELIDDTTDGTLLPSTPISYNIDGIMCIFVLSAVHNDHHIQALLNMKYILKKSTNINSNDGGVIMFRDYGIYDMTMLRHRRRIGQNLYIRNNTTTTSTSNTHTYAYYFDIEYLRQLLEQNGFKVMELEYATVLNCNKKSKLISKSNSNSSQDHVEVHHASEMKRVLIKNLKYFVLILGLYIYSSIYIYLIIVDFLYYYNKIVQFLIFIDIFVLNNLY